MSISRKVYSGYLSLKGILTSKTFKYSFIGIFATLLFFGVFNAYAAEDNATGISPAWEGTKKFHNIISGAEPDEDNMNSRQGLEFLNTTWTIFSLLVPEATENREKVMGEADIPHDLKRGLLGMTEDAGNGIYAAYPYVDVGNHLAQQWVPGFDNSATSLYAADYRSGYEELIDSGIVTLWNRVLNISYVLFVAVMIGAGFMIMFRHKIGGQMMVTLGNVLPGVVLALILATFSFAIAGILIDLGGVIMSVVAHILGGGDYPIRSISNIGSMIIGAFTTVFNDLGSLSPIRTGITGVDKFFDTVSIIIGAIGTFTTPLGALTFLFGIVIAGVVFVGAILVLIVLFKAYFSILLSVIIGPIQITVGALPGNRHMITNWFLGLLRNVLVFPLVLAIINIPNAISHYGGADLMLRLPDKLTFGDQTLVDILSSGVGLNIGGGFVMLIFRVFILYFAAQAPKFLESWFPPAASSKAVGEGFANAKASLTKVPLIGGLFK